MNFRDEDRARSELEQALAGGRADTVAATAMANIWPLFSSHYPLLVAAVESLPGHVLERYPVLRALHPMTPVLARTNRPFKPLVYPDDARRMSPEELDILTLAQIVCFRFSGDVAASLIYARRLDERIQHEGVEARDRVDGPLWYFHHQIASTSLAAGDSASALQTLATATQLARLSRQPDAERLTLGRTALAYAVRGSLDDAASTLARATELSPPTPAHQRSAASTEHAASALVSVERMDADLEDRLSQLEPYDSIELAWAFSLLARARARIVQHRADDALEAIRLAHEAHPPQHGAFASDVITAMSIEAHCANGDLRYAQRIAESRTNAGYLTQLASTRLAIQGSRWSVAGEGIRRLLTNRELTPGARAEALVLSGWMELAQSGSLGPGSAVQLSHIARQGNAQRMFASVPEDVVSALGGVLAGADRDTTLSVIGNLRHSNQEVRPTLTRSELRVLEALTTHTATASIAQAFHVSPNTVKSQLRSVYRKLGCSTRADAIRVGARMNLLDLDSLPHDSERSPRR